MKTILGIVFFLMSVFVHAESVRVQVYEKGQQFWDVKSGQSLSQICQSLGTANKISRRACQQQILKKNPKAFINNNPNRLIVGKRLWLPGSYRSVSQIKNDQYHIKSFSWGSVKTPK